MKYGKTFVAAVLIHCKFENFNVFLADACMPMRPICKFQTHVPKSLINEQHKTKKHATSLFSCSQELEKAGKSEYFNMMVL